MTRDSLLAVGATLLVLGIVLRGVARELRRTIAHRKQHELDTRKPGVSVTAPSHLEKHLGTYASVVAVLGAIVGIAAFFR